MLDDFESKTLEGKKSGFDAGRTAPMRLIILVILASTALILSTAFQLHALAAEDRRAPPFPHIEGSWSCEGYFVRNKRPIASDISITRDAGSGALILHHDDRPPGPYHSLEVWSDGKDGSLKSSISDVYGMRWFAARGWDGKTLRWDRTEGDAVIEQFTYTFGDANILKVDWAVSHDGSPLTIGDTVTCHRTA